MALDLPLDERGSEGHEGLVTKIVLRVAYREIEHVNFDNNVLDFEDGRRLCRRGWDTPTHISIPLHKRHKRKAYRETFSTKDDIRRTPNKSSRSQSSF
jgi:hypothetical protein